MDSPNPTAPPLSIWCLTDGKAGHLNQLRGLAWALQQLQPVTVNFIKVAPHWSLVGDWLRGRFPLGAKLPSPALIVAAGHQTHFAALVARRARAGRLIILMRPSLPTAWFDLCLVPEHDAPVCARHLVLTRGVLNDIRYRPPATHESARGLLLVGGPSLHHGWDSQATARQLLEIVSRDPNRQWRLTTSRRTPASFLAELPKTEHLEVTPVDQTPPGWVGEQMALASHVWVTEDSVSMVYEALTAGAAVGVLPVPRREPSRVTRGMDKLIAENWCTSYQAWLAGTALRLPPEPLNEAARCAQLIQERFLR